jgi:hypothetical protein
VMIQMRTAEAGELHQQERREQMAAEVIGSFGRQKRSVRKIVQNGHAAVEAHPGQQHERRPGPAPTSAPQAVGGEQWNDDEQQGPDGCERGSTDMRCKGRLTRARELLHGGLRRLFEICAPAAVFAQRDQNAVTVPPRGFNDLWTRRGLNSQ